MINTISESASSPSQTISLPSVREHPDPLITRKTRFQSYSGRLPDGDSIAAGPGASNSISTVVNVKKNSNYQVPQIVYFLYKKKSSCVI